jgi:hypothetical protein
LFEKKRTDTLGLIAYPTYTLCASDYALTAKDFKLLGIALLLASLSISAFPTILLFATMLRLALNVASTRVVLVDGHTGHDAAGKVISAPGGTAPTYVDGKLTPLNRDQPIIDHGHDVCVLSNQDVIVCQWNAYQTYPVKLERLAS